MVSQKEFQKDPRGPGDRGGERGIFQTEMGEAGAIFMQGEAVFGGMSSGVCRPGGPAFRRDKKQMTKRVNQWIKKTLGGCFGVFILILARWTGLSRLSCSYLRQK